LKKVCYKVFLCEYYQRHSSNAFTGLYLSVQKWFAGHVPIAIRENLAETAVTTPFRNADLQSIIHL